MQEQLRQGDEQGQEMSDIKDVREEAGSRHRVALHILPGLHEVLH